MDWKACPWLLGIPYYHSLWCYYTAWSLLETITRLLPRARRTESSQRVELYPSQHVIDHSALLISFMEIPECHSTVCVTKSISIEEFDRQSWPSKTLEGSRHMVMALRNKLTMWFCSSSEKLELPLPVASQSASAGVIRNTWDNCQHLQMSQQQ